jgi:deferrochelatase/peroxidase EfeB
MSENAIPRRDFFKGAGAVAAAAATSAAVVGAARSRQGESPATSSLVPFYGEHQSGIATPPPDHVAVAAFDLTTDSEHDIAAMLNAWSSAAALLTRGQSLGTRENTYQPPVDSGEALDLPAAQLTVTIGYTPSFFDQMSRVTRPRFIDPLPTFPGEALDPEISGGDIVVQICSDDPQVNFHAAHSLARLGEGVVAMKYLHIGFGRTSSTSSEQATSRNLLGFKDGTNNLRRNAAEQFRRFVWVSSASEPDWMRGGTYFVHRKIRTHVESWSATSLDSQEAIIGRFKDSGAPLTGTHEDDRPNLSAVDSSGAYIIPAGSHIRVAAPSSNGGEKILRRGYGFADGVDPRTGEFVAGLHFICFQKNPVGQYVAIQKNVSMNDFLSSYLTHVGSVIAAMPRGLRPGQGWGDQLFN